jgi:hypothetical protein
LVLIATKDIGLQSLKYGGLTFNALDARTELSAVSGLLGGTTGINNYVSHLTK